MFKLVCITLLLGYAYGCGVPAFPPIASRVVGGEDARPHSWPWQISLQVFINGRWRHTCGGTLIATNWVLTAAHCIDRNRDYLVYLGKHDLSTPEPGSLAIRPDKIIVKENWDRRSTINDLALLKLPWPLKLNDKIQPACLPPPGSILTNRFCFITGWGQISTDGPLPSILQEAMMPIVNYATCSRPNWWGNIVKTTMICAGGDGKVSGCKGDSGGPLICRRGRVWEVHGITSFVSRLGCNVFEKPTVFTRVSAYTDWIRKTMWMQRDSARNETYNPITA
ncbi:chymotrypsin-like elastase family member 2A [Alligator sinensis]|uniref:Chymotrypsin-like elastase family member 2A n=1 Tax=Alligator sinensis TaxID=38654 RepID=A0A1U7STK6_ALLSI|nr:chymotrypsin-like elastase family member 2A [Alligator sinensis]